MFAVPLLALTAGAALGQLPKPLPPLPGCGPAPLLYVRVTAPEGVRVTFYPGMANGSEYAAPSMAGLRPGYVYHLKLSNLPRQPWLTLHPTLEVFGSLRLSPHVNMADFPAPVHFSEAELDQAAAGALVTKVIYLEHPEKATPTQTGPDELLESDVPPGRDLMHEAWQLGRPVLAIRLGGRPVPEAELVRQAVFGTVLLPGSPGLTPPTRPPCLPYAGWQFYDPLLGPRPPEEECLHDGGDRGPRAGIDPDGNLVGLDPEDTVAEYTDSQDRRRVSCSNRVCLCTPRYAALRHVLPLSGLETVVGPNDRLKVVHQQLMKEEVPSLATVQRKELIAVTGRERPSGTETVVGPAVLKQLQVLEAQHVYLGPAILIGTQEVRTLTDVERLILKRQVELALELSAQSRTSVTEELIGPAVVGRVEAGPQVIRATVETRDLTVCCNEEPHAPEKPLCLFKWCDHQAARPGDEVTFTLKYSNHGGKPITDVAVSDSLTTRLEYVEGSAVSDRNAVFTVQQNEAGSLILRWEVSGRLLPGDSGVVRFKARVR